MKPAIKSAVCKLLFDLTVQKNISNRVAETVRISNKNRIFGFNRIIQIMNETI
jgi:hypothetical protein